MSLLGEELVDVPMYYTYKEVANTGAKRLVILEDDKAIDMLEDEEKKDGIKILNTKWQSLTWKENNDLMKKTGTTNPTTGSPDIDFASFQDLRVKTCLKWWDLKAKEEDTQPLPVSADAIDKLNANVVRALLDKFDTINSVEDEEMGK